MRSSPFRDWRNTHPGGKDLSQDDYRLAPTKVDRPVTPSACNDRSKAKGTRWVLLSSPGTEGLGLRSVPVCVICH